MVSIPELPDAQYLRRDRLAVPDRSRNNYQRLDASLKHTVDPSLVAKLGWVGEVYVKARYVWERNSVDNWQQEGMSPLLYLNDTAVARLIEMGGTNPNYDAQFVQLSLNAKW